MTEKDVRKGEELIKSKEALDKLLYTVCKPFPTIFKNKRIFFGVNFQEISFASFDETTREELKKAIKDVIIKRTEEINKELEEL